MITYHYDLLTLFGDRLETPHLTHALRVEDDDFVEIETFQHGEVRTAAVAYHDLTPQQSLRVGGGVITLA